MKREATQQGAAIGNRRQNSYRESGSILIRVGKFAASQIGFSRRLPIAAPWVLALAFTFQLNAGQRTSASYSITTDTADSGGVRTSSANYTNDGSAGLVAAVSTVASPAESSKSGYIGQL